MEYEQKDMDGVAFKNDKKSEDWHADWNGSAMIDGTMYWINMYDNVSKNGKDYRKFKFKPQNGVASSASKAFSVSESAKKADDLPW